MTESYSTGRTVEMTRPLYNPDLSFLAIGEDIRTIIYHELFDGIEVCAASEELLGRLTLHPHRLCHSDADEEHQHLTPRSYLAITRCSKHIRSESLRVLWSRLARVGTDLPKRSSLTIPNRHLRRVRILEVNVDGCRRSTKLRPDDMESLRVVILNPYIDSVTFYSGPTSPGSANLSSADWDRFVRNFIRRQSRIGRDCIVDHFLSGTLPEDGHADSTVQPLCSMYKVLFRRSLFMETGRVRFEVTPNVYAYAERQHVPQYLDIGTLRCVDIVEYIHGVIDASK